jgi:uncharacterized protein YjbI with pentapeptide repeats
MAASEELTIVLRGTGALNQWRSEHPDRALELEMAGLGGLLLSGADLSKARLTRADLSRTDLTGTDLHSSELPGACLDGALLNGANLRLAQLSNASLRGANLRRATLCDADLSAADLTEADLTGADLQGACLRGARLDNACLLSADLRLADFRGANLDRAVLKYSNLSGCDLAETSLEHADLSCADLTDADLQRANAAQAVLDLARMVRTDLREAVLRGASLQRAVFLDADLREADLTGALVTGISATGLRSEFAKDDALRLAVGNGTVLEVDGLGAALVLQAHAHGGTSGFVLIAGTFDPADPAIARIRSEARGSGLNVAVCRIGDDCDWPELRRLASSAGTVWLFAATPEEEARLRAQFAGQPVRSSTSGERPRGPVSIQHAQPEHAAALGAICYEAFRDIALEHGFEPDFPSASVAEQFLRTLMHRPDVAGAVAIAAGEPVGSGFLSMSSRVGGIGPVTVGSSAQGMGAGRAIMDGLLAIAREHGVESVRLTQDAFNVSSMSLYASLGFSVKAALALVQIAPAEQTDPTIRTGGSEDLPRIGELSARLYHVDRRGDVEAAMKQGLSPLVRERDGRITGYFVPTILGHGVAETNADAIALMRQAARDLPEHFARCFCPLDGSLYREAAAQGCRAIKMGNLMALGPYEQPEGAWLPSVLY